MSESVNTMSGSHEQLVRESIERRHRIRQLKQELDAIKSERDDLRKQLESATAERDKAAEAARTLDEQSKASPDPLRQRVAELEGQIRTRAHQDAFKKLAKDHGVREDAMDDLWTLSGWKPEADEVDERAMRDAIGAAVKARPYLVEAAPGMGAGGPGGPIAAPSSGPAGIVPRAPGPGAGRPAPDGNVPPRSQAEAVLQRVRELSGGREGFRLA